MNPGTFEQLECSAKSVSRNKQKQYTLGQQVQAENKKNLRDERTAREKALEELRSKIYSQTRSTEESGHGIGLKNVQDRVQLYFGEQYGIEIFSKEGCYTKVLIHLPRKEVRYEHSVDRGR